MSRTKRSRRRNRARGRHALNQHPPQHTHKPTPPPENPPESTPTPAPLVEPKSAPSAPKNPPKNASQTPSEANVQTSRTGSVDAPFDPPKRTIPTQILGMPPRVLAVRFMLVILAVLTLIGIAAWRQSRIPAQWWPAPAGDPATVAREGQRIENSVGEAMTRSRGTEPWTVAVRQEEANAWFEGRLRTWIERQRGEWPASLERVGLRIEDDRLILGASVRKADGDSRVVGVAVEPWIATNGELHLDLHSIRINSLALPGVIAKQRVLDWTRQTIGGESPEYLQLKAAFEGRALIERPAIKLSDGRRVRIERIEIEEGRLLITCTTTN